MKKLYNLLLITLLVLGIADISSAALGRDKRVIVVYKEKITNGDMNELKNVNAKIVYKHKIINGVTAYLNEYNIPKLKEDSNVKNIFEDREIHAFLDESVPQIGADKVHIAGVNGSGVKVCILDTGIDKSHPTLSQPIAEYDFWNDDANASDDNGHGTMVAGIVASKDNIYRGVAYSSSLMVGKVLNSQGWTFESIVIEGIEWCVANGANIISMSLGGGAFNSSCDDEPGANASNVAVDKGVVVVAASGNNGYIDKIAAPACGSKVIAVGAVDKQDVHPAWSNSGSELDLVAPGVSITSTDLGGGFTTKSGTSASTPHVSGTVALMLQASPNLSPKQVYNTLITTAKDLGALGFDTTFVYGRVDAYAAYLSIVNNQSNQSNQSNVSNQAPVAIAGLNKTLNDTDGSGTELVTLNGSNSFDLDGLITSYLWKEGSNVLGNTSIVNIFLPIGTHQITLNVTDDYGANSSDTVFISINPNQPPVANAGSDKYSFNDLNIDFDASASFDPDGSIVKYHWDFGDGTASDGIKISHKYSTTGNYVVTLTVTDNGGLISQDTALVILTNNIPLNNTIVFFDDFQNGLAKWKKSGTLRWNTMAPSEIDVPRNNVSNLVAHANSCTNTCTLTINNSLNLSKFKSANLKFWRYVDNDLDNFEYLKVEIFNGVRWQTIYLWTNNRGDDDIWHYETFNLSMYRVKNFMVRFVSRENTINEDTEIDDVTIEGVPLT